MRTRGRFASLLRGLGQVALAAAGTVLLAELVLRLVPPPPPPKPAVARPASFLACDHDSLVGWIYPPNASGLVATGSHPTRLVTNELGLRSPPLSPPRPGCLRIVVLGDSYAFGWGVREDQAFPRVLEGMLRERYPATPLEVVNAGVPGYGVYQQHAMLERLVARMHVDIVVTTFSLGNDPVDDLRILRYAPDRLTQYSPEVGVDSPLVDAIERRSRLLTLLAERTSALRYEMANAGRPATGATRRCMSELFSACAGRGIHVLQLSIPRRSEIAGGGLLARLMTGLYGPARRMREGLARRFGVTSVDAREALLAVEQAGDAYLSDDPHWTPAGHRAVARAVLEALPAEWLAEARRGDRPPIPPRFGLK